MNMIEFQVVFECLICNPVEGMIVECTTRTITKAGIHADVVTEKGYLPMKIFVARDHNYSNRLFGTIKENMNIKVRIIGKRFELNDPYIVAIASLVDFGKERARAEPAGNLPKIMVLPDELEPEEEDEMIEEVELGEEGAPISLPTARGF